MKRYNSCIAVHAQPRRVRFNQNISDRHVAILGEIGMSTAFIAHETGLTECQVIYRLAKAQIRRRDYRNGNSAVADLIVGNVIRSGADSKLVREIEAQVKKELAEKGLV